MTGYDPESRTYLDDSAPTRVIQNHNTAMRVSS